MFDPLVPDTRKGAAAQQSPCRRGRATRAAAVGAGWRTSTASRATVAASRSTGSAADAIPRRRSGGRYSASVESKLVAIGVCVCVYIYIYMRPKWRTISVPVSWKEEQQQSSCGA